MRRILKLRLGWQFFMGVPFKAWASVKTKRDKIRDPKRDNVIGTALVGNRASVEVTL